MKNGKYYVGSTNNVERRFIEHQIGKVVSTMYNRPLQLLYYKMFTEITEARTKEVWLKKQKSKKVIKDFMAL